MFGCEAGLRVRVRFPVRKRLPFAIPHHLVDPVGSFIGMPRPIAMRVMGIGGEEERLLFFFCLGKEFAGKGEILFRVSAHPGLFILPMGWKAEAAPLGTMFSNHPAKVSMI